MKVFIEGSKMSNLNNHMIYLIGGCFWGVEEYFSAVCPVLDAVFGYANGLLRHSLWAYRSDGVTLKRSRWPMMLARILGEILLLLPYHQLSELKQTGQWNSVPYGVYYTDANDLFDYRASFPRNDWAIRSVFFGAWIVASPTLYSCRRIITKIISRKSNG